MVDNKRKLVSFDKLHASIREKLIEEYPHGFGDAVIRIDAPKPFHAVLFKDEDMTYLVKLSQYQINATSIEYDDDDDDNDNVSSEDVLDDESDEEE